MQIIYHCYGGAHSSVVAAALHLNILDPQRLATEQELVSLQLFDKTNRAEHGVFHYLGADEWGNDIYSVGFRNQGTNVISIIRDISRLCGLEEDQLVFANTLDCVNWRMRLGGWLSRTLGQVRLGRPLVVSGTRQAYSTLGARVEEVKTHVCSCNPGEQVKSEAEEVASRKPGLVLYCGVCSAELCAAYHVGRLPANRPPRPGEIGELTLAEGRHCCRRSQLAYFGTDDTGLEVFAADLGSCYLLGRRAIKSWLNSCLGARSRQVLLRDCTHLGGLAVLIGGFLEHHVGHRRLGQLVVAFLLRRNWQRFVALVQETERLLHNK